MEQQAQSQLPTAIARGHNAVHVAPADWANALGPLASAIDRIDPMTAGVQLLVVVSDSHAAVELTRAVAAARGGGEPRAIAATGAARTARVLRAEAAPILVAAPREILALLRASALKLEGLRGLAIAWVDQIIDAGGMAELEAVMAEAPKDVPRTVITATLTPAVEDMLERYARRAARTGDSASSALSAGASPTAATERPSTARPTGTSTPTVSYVLVTPSARAGALTRLLDEVDPPSASVYVRSDESEGAVRETLQTLGYHGGESAIRLARQAPGEHTALLVLYDLPRDAEELRGAISGVPARMIAMVSPRQLPHLRGLVGNVMSPYVSPAAVASARSTEDAVRAELRQELAAGPPAREVLLLEPLLAEYDGVALAAAALHLLDRSRAVATPARAAGAAALADHRDYGSGPRHRGAADSQRSVPPFDQRPHSLPDSDRRVPVRGRDSGPPSRGGRRDDRGRRDDDRDTARGGGRLPFHGPSSAAARSDRGRTAGARSGQRQSARAPKPEGSGDSREKPAEPGRPS